MSIAFVAAAGGGAWAWLSKRSLRPLLHVCRLCGADVSEGDLCAACRHEAAESQRRSTLEQAESQRRLADEARRAQEQLEKLHQKQDQQGRQAQELPEHAEIDRQRDAAKRREEETRRWQEQAAAAIAPAVDTADDTADANPHAVLGVPPTASLDEIRTAYDACRAKYASDQVAHLSQDLQDRFRLKAAAVEKAFQTLTASQSS
jgi:predicted NBD/HSP70 family sugar kinase